MRFDKLKARHGCIFCWKNENGKHSDKTVVVHPVAIKKH